jgi:predicted nuclease with TOPRIM domain
MQTIIIIILIISNLAILFFYVKYRAKNLDELFKKSLHLNSISEIIKDPDLKNVIDAYNILNKNLLTTIVNLMTKLEKIELEKIELNEKIKLLCTEVEGLKEQFRTLKDENLL